MVGYKGIAQGLHTLAALEKSPLLVPSTHMVAYNCTFNSRGSVTIWPLHLDGTYEFREAYIHANNQQNK